MKRGPEISIQQICLRPIFALVLFVTAANVWAGSFTATPVRIEISSRQPNAVLQVTNREDQPVTFQVHAVSWNFEGEKDVLVDNDQVLLNPPIAIVGPHRTQAIRLGLRHMIESGQEGCYRLILEEVPPPPSPGFTGVRTLLKISIPFFVSPKNTAAPSLHWNAVKINDSHLKLIATNQGNAHIQIKSMNVARAQRSGADSSEPGVTEILFQPVLPVYLLPDQQREWTISGGNFPAQITITGVTDAGTLGETVDIAP